VKENKSSLLSLSKLKINSKIENAYTNLIAYIPWLLLFRPVLYNRSLN